MNKCHKIRNYLNQNQPDLQEVVPRNNRLNQQNKLTRPGKRFTLDYGKSPCYSYEKNGHGFNSFLYVDQAGYMGKMH